MIDVCFLQLSTAGTKMLVSNLGPEVTDEDLDELFTEHGGPIKKAEIFYKQDGTSSGTGEVIFKRRADADKVDGLACKQREIGRGRQRKRRKQRRGCVLCIYRYGVNTKDGIGVRVMPCTRMRV